jgi:pyruvate dehydrogenase E2 component (dihydrolipoamide acetyltransferase)
MNDSALSSAGRPARVAASPRARRLMRALAIDPQAVRGSGPGGRIVEADVRRAQSAGPMPAVPARGTAPATGAQPAAGGISTMRRAIARLTTASATSVPHFYVRAEADASALVACREQLIDRIQADVNVRLSFTDLLLRAQTIALAALPAASATWQNDTLVPAESIDVGLVVSVSGGLLIPVIRQADRLSLADLVRTRHEVVAAARSGRASADSMSGGVSSLSNLGNSRVDEFSALIAPPQSSILAVGRLAPRPYVVDGQLVVRPTVRLTLAADHRVMDGALAADLLGRIVTLIEQPTLLLYH